MPKSSENSPRNNSGEKVSVETYPEVIAAFLRTKFAPMRNSEKLLARLARVSPRTAENWLRGNCAPQGEALLNLMAECDGLADRILHAVNERKQK